MDAIKRQAQRLQKKGTIEIRVYNGDYGRKGGDTPGTSEGFLNKSSINVPESALKGQAKSHGTRYVESQAFQLSHPYLETMGRSADIEKLQSRHGTQSKERRCLPLQEEGRR
jgi:hypothetical protein